MAASAWVDNSISSSLSPDSKIERGHFSEMFSGVSSKLH